MATFVFRVGTPNGQIVDRRVEATSLEKARKEVESQGFHVFDVKRRSLRPSFRFGSRVLSTERFLLFNQELLALVRAGLPIVQSLDIMLERQENPRFREILADIRDQVRSGVALSDAFASYGSLFPPIYSNSLRAGERSGDLEGVIRRFLRYQKLIVAIRKKVTGALIYPTVLVAISIVMIYIMLTVVIPKFTEFYSGFDAELPALTRFLIGVAFFVRENSLLTLIAVVVGIFLLRRMGRTRTGGLTLDRLKLKVPFAGNVIHSFAIMQFTQSLGTLLAGGTPMVPALETASESVTNSHVSSRIKGIVQQVREGEPLWLSLESTGVMSSIAIEMIKVGESTGALVEMLANVGEFYDEEIENKLNRMMALLEPAILVLLGLVIAGLLYAFYLPLFEITKVQNV
ncbi:MAG: type II secretion system F family protein [Thermoanaerobaculia bacterium]|nr:type II secretion system F family protein [Thermoanaerobaculia bacterium]